MSEKVVVLPVIRIERHEPDEGEPRIVHCTHCDFGTGMRGMDSCSKCKGTGSRFLVVADGKPHFFPNTEAGYGDAKSLIAALTPDPQP